MRSIKTLGVFLLVGMAAVALAASPAQANFNPCQDLEGEAQEACVDRYTVESPPERAYSDEEAQWRADNDALRQEIIEAVLEDYRNLETWKERLEFIRGLREDAQESQQRGELNDAASWDVPLPPDVTILDADLSEEAVGEEMYREFELLGLRSCNISGGTHSFPSVPGTVAITGSCTWEGANITVNGQVRIDPFSSLTIRTSSSASASVLVKGRTLYTVAIFIKGTLHLKGMNSGRHVHLYVGTDKAIRIDTEVVEDHGYLKAEGSSGSRVYFWGENYTAWRGIYAQGQGARVLFDGGITATKGVYIYSIAQSRRAIWHKGGSFNKQGLLFVRGARFYGTSSAFDQRGIDVDISTPPGTHNMGYDIDISHNSFWRYEYPVRLKNFDINKKIHIKHNEASHSLDGIVLEDVRSTGKVEIAFNAVEASYIGISLNDVAPGGVYDHVMIASNSITGTGCSTTAILLKDVFQRTGGTCRTLVEDNTVLVNNDGISYVIESVDEYMTACSQNSILQIASNNITSPLPHYSCTAAGIRVRGLPCTASSRDHLIASNILEQVFNGVVFERAASHPLEPIMAFAIQQNEFLFTPDLTVPNANLISSQDAVHGFLIGGNNATLGNVFGWNWDNPFWYHIYLGPGSSNNICQNNVFLDQYGNPGGTPNLYGITCN